MDIFLTYSHYPLLIPVGENMFTRMYFYEPLEFRKPLKGEYYLSGAEVRAWKALNDLSTEFIVVTLGEELKHGSSN